LFKTFFIFNFYVSCPKSSSAKERKVLCKPFSQQNHSHRKQLKLVPKFIVVFLSQKIYSPNQSFTISNTKKNATFERYVLGHKKPHGFVFNHKTQKLFFGPKKKSISFFLAERKKSFIKLERKPTLSHVLNFVSLGQKKSVNLWMTVLF